MLGCPTYAPDDLIRQFDNQIGALNEVRVDDEAKELKNREVSLLRFLCGPTPTELSQDPFIHEWVQSSDVDDADALADLITVTLGNKYVVSQHCSLCASAVG